jgi:riboflavin biosynthesis pyrimidine reductase
VRDVIGEAIEQGVVDELQLHLAPMLLGDGILLFRGLRAPAVSPA